MAMKIKDGFILREVAGQWLVVPLGERVVEFNGMITLSESGALIWKALETESSVDDLVAKVLSEYDIDEATARADVDEFLGMMREKELLA
ncbi:MAG: PqqD family protein [Acidobacteriota bacterium]